MKRGEIWVLRDDGYASKPRPVVVIQSDEITQFQSVVLCLLTSLSQPTCQRACKLNHQLKMGYRKPVG